MTPTYFKLFVGELRWTLGLGGLVQIQVKFYNRHWESTGILSSNSGNYAENTDFHHILIAIFSYLEHRCIRICQWRTRIWSWWKVLVWWETPTGNLSINADINGALFGLSLSYQYKEGASDVNAHWRALIKVSKKAQENTNCLIFQ